MVLIEIYFIDDFHSLIGQDLVLIAAKIKPLLLFILYRLF